MFSFLLSVTLIRPNSALCLHRNKRALNLKLPVSMVVTARILLVKYEAHFCRESDLWICETKKFVASLNYNVFHSTYHVGSYVSYLLLSAAQAQEFSFLPELAIISHFRSGFT